MGVVMAQTSGLKCYVYLIFLIAAVIVSKPTVFVVGVNIAKSVVDWLLLVLKMKLISRLINLSQ